MKMNSLVNADMIDRLYAASGAGVQVDLLIRGICCLRPGVPGLSENIRVRSIVGRYLEHSRIYRFEHGADARDEDTGDDDCAAGPTPAYYIGSADMMPRNLDRRVEALVPVNAPGLRRQIDEILAVSLADDSLAWTLHGDGTWSHVTGAGEVDTHRHLQELALERRTGS
jgi:polyphosphate kinase